MKLIEPLASGLAGAEGGSVTLLIYGTGSLAPWYSDFEGLCPQVLGTVQLDVNGSAIVYVGQLCTVQVFDINGTSLRQFVAGDAAPNVEVVSRSFTGASYSDGSIGTGRPTTLQSVLDGVETSFGAPDWKVLVNGNAVAVEDALASLTQYFNVRAPVYGAVGDGTTDDTGSIQSAINGAAAAGGGVVFLPPGKYKLTAALKFSAAGAELVSLLGAGATSVLSQSVAAQATLSFDTSPTVWTNERFIRDLVLLSSTVQTANQVEITSEGQNIAFYGVHFFPGTGHGLDVASTLNLYRLRMLGCRFDLYADPGKAINVPARGIVASSLSVMQCCFGALPGYVGNAFQPSSWVYATTGSVVGCVFDFANVTSGNSVGVEVAPISGNLEDLVVQGCRFSGAGAGGAVYAMQDSYGVQIGDFGNTFNANTIVPFVSEAIFGPPKSTGGHRSMENESYDLLGVPEDKLTMTLDFVRKSVYCIERTGITAQAITVNPMPAMGRTITIVLQNSSGGAALPAGSVTVLDAVGDVVATNAGGITNGYALVFVFRVTPVVVSSSIRLALVLIGKNEGAPHV